MTTRSLFDKVWDAHVVRAETESTPAILAIDLHLLHEVTSPQAFTELERRGLKVAWPEKCIATMDHSIPTHPSIQPTEAAAAQLTRLSENCARHGIRLLDQADPGRGIVHVIGPEQGWTRPGMTIVCGDSHTSTHGAFGSLAFGIGTSEVSHVLATQCMLQRKPKSMRVQVEGELPAGTSAKDLVLHIIRCIGMDGGTGYVIEYAGSAIEQLNMEQRMTVCNMSIEAGARAGMIAPDEVTFAYLEGKEQSPLGADWDRAVAYWRSLASDPNCRYDRVVHVDASNLKPLATWGTDPSTGIELDARIEGKAEYMGFSAGQRLKDRAVDVVFIGSCTNGRLSDLNAAAEVLRGRRVAPGVRMLVVPGSQRVATEAESLGLDQVFTAAGAEWRQPGCSMCIAMNGDFAKAGQTVVSTSNRNFAGRQGIGARTVLASPQTAAASAVSGYVVSVAMLNEQQEVA